MVRDRFVWVLEDFFSLDFFFFLQSLSIYMLVTLFVLRHSVAKSREWHVVLVPLVIILIIYRLRLDSLNLGKSDSTQVGKHITFTGGPQRLHVQPTLRDHILSWTQTLSPLKSKFISWTRRGKVKRLSIWSQLSPHLLISQTVDYVPVIYQRSNFT